jgi:hypothetical protein
VATKLKSPAAAAIAASTAQGGPPSPASWAGVDARRGAAAAGAGAGAVVVGFCSSG